MPRSRHPVKCSAATLADNPDKSRGGVLSKAAVALYSRGKCVAPERRDRMETMMQKLGAAMAAIAISVLGVSGAKADYVPAFKGNDTGGIISYNLVGQTDVKALAVEGIDLGEAETVEVLFVPPHAVSLTEKYAAAVQARNAGEALETIQRNILGYSPEQIADHRKRFPHMYEVPFPPGRYGTDKPTPVPKEK